jgi:hypothetical protein
MGLYQDTVKVFTGTGTTAGSVNSSSFSAANFSGGAAVSIAFGAGVTGTSPTVALQLQSSYDGGVTWNNVTATTGSLTDALTVSATAAVSSTQVNKFSANTVYVGNLLRVVVTYAGTGSVNIPVTIYLDAQKRFADNA